MSAAMVREKVQRILIEKLNDVRLQEDGFRVPFGSTMVDVDIIDQPEAGDGGRVLVRLFAFVLRDVPATPALFQWIAIEGQQKYFGAYGFLPKPDAASSGMLKFEHTLLGDYLDPEELWQALAGVAAVADTDDDELQARFGGRRAVDD